MEWGSPVQPGGTAGIWPGRRWARSLCRESDPSSFEPVAGVWQWIEWGTRSGKLGGWLWKCSSPVMWRVAGNGWLYVITDPERAGGTVVTISVTDLDQFIAELGDRGISAGPIEAVGNAGRKANVVDADGNVISWIRHHQHRDRCCPPQRRRLNVAVGRRSLPRSSAVVSRRIASRVGSCVQSCCSAPRWSRPSA